jgi:hypothetical protein
LKVVLDKVNDTATEIRDKALYITDRINLNDLRLQNLVEAEEI